MGETLSGFQVFLYAYPGFSLRSNPGLKLANAFGVNFDNTPMPEINRLPAFDAMLLGLQEEREEIAEERATKKHKRKLDLD